MNSFVLNTIVKDCWNATGKYFSATVRPTRVSKTGGSLHAARIARRFITPPKTNILEPFFHYYQVGDIEPYLFSVNKFAKNEWVSVEKLMVDNEIFINQAFFLTQINHPITGNINSKGNIILKTKTSLLFLKVLIHI